MLEKCKFVWRFSFEGSKASRGVSLKVVRVPILNRVTRPPIWSIERIPAPSWILQPKTCVKAYHWLTCQSKTASDSSKWWPQRHFRVNTKLEAVAEERTCRCKGLTESPTISMTWRWSIVRHRGKSADGMLLLFKIHIIPTLPVHLQTARPTILSKIPPGCK